MAGRRRGREAEERGRRRRPGGAAPARRGQGEAKAPARRARRDANARPARQAAGRRAPQSGKAGGQAEAPRAPRRNARSLLAAKLLGAAVVMSPHAARCSSVSPDLRRAGCPGVWGCRAGHGGSNGCEGPDGLAGSLLLRALGCGSAANDRGAGRYAPSAWHSADADEVRAALDGGWSRRWVYRARWRSQPVAPSHQSADAWTAAGRCLARDAAGAQPDSRWGLPVPRRVPVAGAGGKHTGSDRALQLAVPGGEVGAPPRDRPQPIVRDQSSHNAWLNLMYQ